MRRQSLLPRLLSSRACFPLHVEYVAQDTATGHEVLEYEATADAAATITLRGSSAVAVASALNWYLKNEVRVFAARSWSALPPFEADALPNLPLPLPKAKRRMVRPVRFSWYANVCTASYSHVWWNWTRWEQEIDLMALQGVNIMYAHTGTEYVQAKVWTALLGPNATRGIADYFVGPAFLAWFRMGNIKKWGGPMPATFLAKQHQLQLQILPRLHSLGIIGVLPAFAGFVPDALRYAYPNASIRTGSLWMQSSEYSGVDVLAATDPLFSRIGAMFIEGYRSAYSSSAYSLQHFYSADSFNENSPASGNASYLHDYAAATHRAMTSVDVEAVWVLQAWAFGSNGWTDASVGAYLSGVSNSSMLLLDLVSDQMPLWDGAWASLHSLLPGQCCTDEAGWAVNASCVNCPGKCCDPATTQGPWMALAATHTYQNYYGKAWVFCSLNNYGGNNGNFGLIPTQLRAPAAAHAVVKSRGLDNMVGVGITLEGIHTNWVTNEALLSQGWEFFVPHANAKENASLNKWVQDFVSRRYNSGGNATMLQSAWSRLANFSTTSVYNGPRGNYFEGWGNTRSLVTRRPFWPLGEASGWGWNNDGTSDGFMGDAPRYDPRALLQALRELLSGAAAGESSSSLPTSLAVDVVDLCVTTMANAWLVQLGGMINMTSGNMTSKKVAQIQALGAEMIAGIAVTDEVLASNENFLLGKWISDAKSWAKPWAFHSSSEKKEEESGEDEAALLEFNARNQVTMWGPPLFVGANPSRYGSPGSPQDYAAKTWAGLYGSFYLQRQQLFFNMLNDAATEAVAVDAAPIDFVKLAPKFTNASVAFEVRWGASTSSEVFASTPTGNTFALAAKAVETYGAIVDNATWCQIEYVGKLWYNVDKGGVMNFWVMSEFVDHLLHSNPNYYFSLVRCEGPAAGRI